MSTEHDKPHHLFSMDMKVVMPKYNSEYMFPIWLRDLSIAIVVMFAAAKFLHPAFCFGVAIAAYAWCMGSAIEKHIRVRYLKLEKYFERFEKLYNTENTYPLRTIAILGFFLPFLLEGKDASKSELFAVFMLFSTALASSCLVDLTDSWPARLARTSQGRILISAIFIVSSIFQITVFVRDNGTLTNIDITNPHTWFGIASLVLGMGFSLFFFLDANLHSVFIDKLYDERLKREERVKANAAQDKAIRARKEREVEEKKQFGPKGQFRGKHSYRHLESIGLRGCGVLSRLNISKKSKAFKSKKASIRASKL